MTGVRLKGNGFTDVYRGCFALTFVLVCMAPGEAMSAAPPLRRDSTRCLAHGSVSACNDAIRWSPSDPALLMALADAELRANRPADALRHYRRAAQLAPNTGGLNAKISAAEARLHPTGSSMTARHTARTTPGAPLDSRYSNTAPLAESH